MRVKAIASTFANAPEEVLRSGWSKDCDPGITEGREYTVYAISVFKQPMKGFARLIFFQIVEDVNLPTWLPSFLFKVVDRSMPHDWECNILPSGTFIIGPAFITESDGALQAMEDQEPEPMRKFRARQREIE